MNRMRTSLAAAIFGLLALPAIGVSQNPELVGSFRPYLFVLLAYAAAWLLIGAWVYRIGRKLSSLMSEMEKGPDASG